MKKYIFVFGAIIGYVVGIAVAAIILNNYSVVIPVKDIPGYTFRYENVEYVVIVHRIIP